KIRQQGCIELAPGDGPWCLRGIDTRDSRAETACNHLFDKRVRGHTPERKEGRNLERTQLLLAVATNVFEKEISERDRTDTVVLCTPKGVVHRDFVLDVRARARDLHFDDRQPHRPGLRV